MKTIRPTKDNIYCLPDEKENKTKSGFITTPVGTPAETAVILAIGPDVTTVVVGERVFYRQYASNEISLDGDKYFVVNESEVIGVVEND